MATGAGRKTIDRRSLLLALAIAVATLGSVSWVSLAGAAQPKCLVVNVRTAHSHCKLQTAVNAATSGDTLKVKGTCYGDTTISNSLTIVGQSNPGFGPARLNGDNNAQSPGSVIVDRGATVAITGLTIVGGYNNERAREDLGGPVTRDTAEKGGGIYNQRGSLTLTNSTVSGNTATFSGKGYEGETFGGGGIYNELGSLTLDNSTVDRNSGLGDGGGIANAGGLVQLTDSTVGDNTATYSDRGIQEGTVGGGIYNSGGEVWLTSSTVSHNKSGGFGGGGGIYNEQGSLALSNSTITGNSGYNGGGINNQGALALNGSSSVSENTASEHGGGIFNTQGATISYGTGWTGTVSGNIPDDIFSE